MNVPKIFLVASLFIGTFLFYSCEEKDSDIFRVEEAQAFSDTLMPSNVYELDVSESFYNPMLIDNINDEYLLVSEYLKEDFFRVFKLPEVEYLYAWGINGRGPGEFQTTPVHPQVIGDTVIPYDGISRSLKYLAVDDSTLEYVGEKELWHEGQMQPLNRMFRINDSLYFADHGSGMEDTNAEHIALQPDNKDSLFTFGKYPETELEGFERYSEFMKTSAAKPDGSKFAAFYLNYNQVKIYNSEGRLLNEVEIQDPYIEMKEEMRFRSIKEVSDSYIYALGLYESYESIHEESDTDITTSLEVWDWEGHMIYRAKFDRKIHHFTVSEAMGKFYGISYFSMSQIMEYDLSTVLSPSN
jgi:hypothetical protein